MVNEHPEEVLELLEYDDYEVVTSGDEDALLESFTSFKIPEKLANRYSKVYAMLSE